MATAGPLARTPFFSFGRRPYREERLASYIRREHARGRRVREILRDPYVRRLGGTDLVGHVLRRTDLLDAIERDVADAIRAATPSGSGPRDQSSSMASPKE